MVSSTSSILLFCIILIILRQSTAQICYDTGNFTTNSTYGKNRNSILSSLASKVRANAGFYTDTLGQDSDMVYVLGHCRGDLSEESCFNCVNSSSQAIMKNCTNQKEATGFGDTYLCTVRCSDKNFSRVTRAAMFWFKPANITTNYVDEFDQALQSLALSLVEKVALGPPRFRFATGKKNFEEYQSIFALMECIPTISSNGCRDCLKQSVDDYQTCCVRRQWVVIVGPSCVFQYEYPFSEVISDPSPLPLPPPVAVAPLPPSTNTTINEGNRSRKLRTAMIIAVSVSILLVLIGCAFFRLQKRGNIKSSQPDIPTKGDGKIDLPLFDVATIAEATNNFSTSNKIGEGGFGPVFKGQLSTGQVIAVKRNSENSKQGLRELKNEVILFSKLQHRNLVKLLGGCIQGEETMLIYEYMPNGSLNSFIFGNKRNSLTWSIRFNIIVGIARGLLYLHRDSRLRIIHRDLKASNVLLDSEMSPKIADFGCARAFGGDQLSEKTKRVIGTYGYMPPEYVIDGLFSIKSDVFSFGVLVLEIVTGKRNREFRHSDHGLTLLGHVWKLWVEGKALELVDEQMEDLFPASEVVKCIQVGLLCVQHRPEDRPTMPLVLLALDSESAMLSQPEQPGFYTERTTIETQLPLDAKQSTVNEQSLTVLSGR
ncbi:cysteine-rich receptor-like protein kinase 25 isoform X1 [Actinidia eriantha]|uniref:cysteine-rich receptor-like protein kinase 25 isoform X1 n=1 Tax=Actinidia eriantha TaxID=165200 RepID=UPI002589272B|nr:cysteine-rich receptor-like protein kinase 25 isoform X1 [Actinidia eriantha]